MKKLIHFFVIAIVQAAFAQVETPYAKSTDNNPLWIQLMYAENPNPGAIAKAYDTYYKEHDFVKDKHTQYYKRWKRTLSRQKAKPTREYIEASLSTSRNTNSWIARGPFDFDIDAASRSYAPGAAHIYCVEQSLSNTNRIYAGTATAGFWRSDDKGENWYCISKELPINNVYAMEIDPNDEDVVYFSGGGTLYKSSNGGASHTDIGAGEFSSGISVKEIMIHNSKLWVASNQGLYYSTDGGNSFNMQESGTWLEMEVHPTNNNIIYAVRENTSSTSFFKSTDNGTTFTEFNTGWPSPNPGDEQKRTEIAVSAAAPNKVVALATGVANGGSGLYGIYISEDQGETWSFQCCGDQEGGPASAENINMMGWSDEGTDDGGQYYYDLALAVNPENANIIHVAGVQHWISTDGGLSFNCPAKWSHPDKDQYIHADIHDMRYFGEDLWVACDGGVFYSNNAGDNFDKKMYGISGTDFWGFGTGFSDGEVMLGGTYHNGTMIKDREVYEGGWLCAEGGDNYRGFVNFADDRKVYTDNGGRLLPGDRTQSLGSFTMDKNPNASYIVGESSNLEFDPRSPNILYIGNGTQLYKSTDGGSSTNSLYDFGENVTSVEVAWSNTNYIYVCTYPGWWDTKKIYRSTDAGDSWVEITPSSNTINGQTWIPYDITVSSENANHIWMARTSMYGTPSDGQGHDVFKSTNGGTSWTNLSTATINNENITNIEYHRGSNGGVYIGTRQAVYYRNNNMTDWVLYNNNLPLQTFSTQLIPYYKEGKLKNGTNQGVWEVDFYEEVTPSAQIAANRFNINCTNNIVQFYNHSAMRTDGASYNWQFEGGIPATSNEENPLVYYENPGQYDVTLAVTDLNGADSQTLSSFIHFTDESISEPDLMQQNFEEENFPPENWMLPTAGFSWQTYDFTSGVDCEASTAAYVNNYYISQAGGEAALLSPKYNLAPLTNATLQFDYAYARYGAGYSDGLKVEISTDCGTNWNTLWEAYGLDLATVSDQSNWWEPTCEDWGQLYISLSEYANQVVNIRFVAINGYGNSLFIDNVNFVNNDGTLPVINPIPGCIDPNATNYNPQANIDDESCSYISYATQNINLEEGWNIFSTYIIPEDPSLETVLSEINDHIVIVKDFQGLAYLPEWNFNAIGNLNNAQGYQAKLNQTMVLSVDGEMVAPENLSIPINQGWNIISYTRQEPANASLVLEEISNEIIIVKDYLGNAYLPTWDFNGIGNMAAGKGYQVKAENAISLNYISNDATYKTEETLWTDNKSQLLDFNKNTGSNMHIVIPMESWSMEVKQADEIHIYDAENALVGAAKITLPTTVVCVWGNDDTTTEKEGLFIHENWTAKHWSKATNRWQEIEIIHEGDPIYAQNTVLVAHQILNNNNTVKCQLFHAVPNPANKQSIIRIYFNESMDYSLELYDIIGKRVKTISSGKADAGYHEYKIELNDLSSGSYFYRLKTEHESYTKRLKIIK